MDPALSFSIVTTAISALLLFCWIMEMLTIRKLREGHREECRRLREEHFVAIKAARNEGWYEGVEYQRNLMTPKRDKAGRFA